MSVSKNKETLTADKEYKLRLLVVLGGGGHTAEMLKLIDLLGERFYYSYLISIGDKLSALKIKTRGTTYFIHKARDHGDVPFKTAVKLMRLFLESLVVLVRENPDVVISAGPGLAVPISVLAKFFRKRVIFIETISRVYRPSLAGRILANFSDLFFVQWPEMKKIYPKALYAGRLL
jgi:UDP-N-acetylglucosamine:LPS N-acetylglucosamine transferase